MRHVQHHFRTHRDRAPTARDMLDTCLRLVRSNAADEHLMTRGLRRNTGLDLTPLRAPPAGSYPPERVDHRTSDEDAGWCRQQRAGSGPGRAASQLKPILREPFVLTEIGGAPISRPVTPSRCGPASNECGLCARRTKTERRSCRCVLTLAHFISGSESHPCCENLLAMIRRPLQDAFEMWLQRSAEWGYLVDNLHR